MGKINEYIKKLIKRTKKVKDLEKPWLDLYEGVPESLDYYSGSLYDAIKESGDKYANLVAYEYFAKRCTYKDFIKKVDKAARALKAMGIKENECVTICMPNIPEGVALVYAANAIGAIANMVHPLGALNDIEYALNSTDSSVLFVSDVTYTKVKDIKVDNLVVCEVSNELDGILKVLYNIKNKKNMMYEDNVITWNRFLDMGKGIDKFYTKREKEDPAVIIYSGGTTGKSKGIILSNGNFNALARQCTAIEQTVVPGNSILSALPIFHGFGLGVCIHMPLYNGMRCLLVPKLNTKKINKELKKYKPNLLPVVPSLLALTCKGKSGSELKHIKGIFCGGDYLSIELKDKTEAYFRERGSKAKIRIGYGLSEATAFFLATYNHIPYEAGSIGIPNPDTIVKVFQVGTEIECEDGQVGEICVNGPTVMMGYINNDKETDKVLIRHSDDRVWLHTGDLGYRDSKGQFFFSSRLKRMIITNGYNVYPLEVEELICKHPYVDSCVVIGIKHEVKQQVPKAVIVLKEGIEESLKVKSEIKKYCEDNLAVFERPAEYEFKESLPKTAIGKVAYRDLED
ncbi:MAG: AMP-binding protein [Bacilli bacterium]|nr:AMP-binding protein [Bacilli bacterium]